MCGRISGSYFRSSIMPAISGMIVPIVTPLTTDQQVDVSALKQLCEVQIEAGIDAIFVLGTTGEFYGLTPPQRRLVVDVSIEVIAGRVPVLVGIGGDSTASSIDTLQTCRRPEVSGYVASTPYFLSYTQDELFDHFSALSEAAGQPLVLYNYPGRYRHIIEIDTIARLLEKKLVFAIKDTQGDLDYMRRLLELKKSFPEFLVFEGALPNLGLSAPLGIDGTVQASGSLLPRENARLWSLAKSKQWSALNEGVARLWEFHQATEQVMIYIAGLKGCMALRGRTGCTPAKPTREATPEQSARLKALLDKYYPE
jgi:dihydrodipicolinate synthase/N-acetylneuraminate lyase